MRQTKVLHPSDEYRVRTGTAVLPGGRCCRSGDLVCVLRRVQGVDDLALAGVMQFFAGFALDLVGVALEMVDVVLEMVIFLLEAFDLAPELAIFDALLLIGGDAVAPDDYVVCEDDGQDHCQRCGNTAADAEEKASYANPDPDLRFVFDVAHVCGFTRRAMKTERTPEIYDRRGRAYSSAAHAKISPGGIYNGNAAGNDALPCGFLNESRRDRMWD